MPQIDTNLGTPVTALLALVLACLVLTACGGSSSSNAASTASTTTASTASTSKSAAGGATGSAGSSAATVSKCVQKNGARKCAQSSGSRSGTHSHDKSVAVRIQGFFAACLRANGVNVPKSKASGSSLSGADTASAAFKAAVLKCRRDLLDSRSDAGRAH
jgi:hypothetical protein